MAGKSAGFGYAGVSRACVIVILVIVIVIVNVR